MSILRDKSAVISSPQSYCARPTKLIEIILFLIDIQHDENVLVDLVPDLGNGHLISSKHSDQVGVKLPIIPPGWPIFYH